MRTFECAANIPFNYHFLTAFSLYERLASDFNGAYFDLDDNCSHSGESMKENELFGNLVNKIEIERQKVLDGIEID